MVKLDKTNMENFLCTRNIFLPINIKFVENTQARLRSRKTATFTLGTRYDSTKIYTWGGL